MLPKTLGNSYNSETVSFPSGRPLGLVSMLKSRSLETEQIRVGEQQSNAAFITALLCISSPLLPHLSLFLFTPS